MIAFTKNILWLNIKKLRINIFWRIVFVLISFMLFFSSTLRESMGGMYCASTFIYVFIIVSLANVLFIYNKISSEMEVVWLLRSLGASKTFIVINNLVEMAILFVIGFTFFAISTIFIPADWNMALIGLLELVVIAISCLIFSMMTVFRAEKIEKAK